MTEELIKHRIDKFESDIENLYGKVNETCKTQAATSVKLDNILEAIGELKEKVTVLQSRPTVWWDKLVTALLGAFAALAVNMLVK